MDSDSRPFRPPLITNRPPPIMSDPSSVLVTSGIAHPTNVPPPMMWDPNPVPVTSAAAHPNPTSLPLDIPSLLTSGAAHPTNVPVDIPSLLSVAARQTMSAASLWNECKRVLTHPVSLLQVNSWNDSPSPVTSSQSFQEVTNDNSYGIPQAQAYHRGSVGTSSSIFDLPSIAPTNQQLARANLNLPVSSNLKNIDLGKKKKPPGKKTPASDQDKEKTPPANKKKCTCTIQGNIIPCKTHPVNPYTKPLPTDIIPNVTDSNDKSLTYLKMEKMVADVFRLFDATKLSPSQVRNGLEVKFLLKFIGNRKTVALLKRLPGQYIDFDGHNSVTLKKLPEVPSLPYLKARHLESIALKTGEVVDSMEVEKRVVAILLEHTDGLSFKQISETLRNRFYKEFFVNSDLEALLDRSSLVCNSNDTWKLYSGNYQKADIVISKCAKRKIQRLRQREGAKIAKLSPNEKKIIDLLYPQLSSAASSSQPTETASHEDVLTLTVPDRPSQEPSNEQATGATSSETTNSDQETAAAATGLLHTLSSPETSNRTTECTSDSVDETPENITQLLQSISSQLKQLDKRLESVESNQQLILELAVKDEDSESE